MQLASSGVVYNSDGGDGRDQMEKGHNNLGQRFRTMIQTGMNFYKSFTEITSGNADFVLKKSVRAYNVDIWDIEQTESDLSYTFIDRQQKNGNLSPIIFYCNNTYSTLFDCESMVEFTKAINMSVFMYDPPGVGFGSDTDALSMQGIEEFDLSSLKKKCKKNTQTDIAKSLYKSMEEAFNVLMSLISSSSRRVIMMGHRSGCEGMMMLLSSMFKNKHPFRMRIDSVHMLSPKITNYYEGLGYKSMLFSNEEITVPIHIYDLVYLKSTEPSNSMGMRIYNRMKNGGGEERTYMSIQLDEETRIRKSKGISLKTDSFNFSFKTKDEEDGQNNTILDYMIGDYQHYMDTLLERLKTTSRFLDRCLFLSDVPSLLDRDCLGSIIG